MPEIFGRIERNRVEDGEQHTVFFIPAVTKTGAIGRARGNARLKGLRNFTVTETESVSGGWEITVTAQR